MSGKKNIRTVLKEQLNCDGINSNDLKEIKDFVRKSIKENKEPTK